MRGHVTILGWLQIALGLLDLLLAALVFGFFAGMGLLGGLAGGPALPVMGGVLGTVVGGIMALTGIPNLVAGWGLLKRRPWGRILALLLALLNALKFPWGTVFAGYTWWVLTDAEVEGSFGA